MQPVSKPEAMEWTRDRGRVQSEYINLNLTKLIEKLSTREGWMEGERYGVREGEMVRARFDQILLGRKQREGWKRANSINAIRKYHILENPAMRLEGKKEQLRAE